MMHLVIYGVLLPVVVGTMLAAIIWRPWSVTGVPLFRGGYWILPLALAVVLPLGAWGVLSGFRYNPPVSAIERFIVAGSLIGVLALASSLVDRPRRVAVGIYFAAFAMAFAFFAKSKLGGWGVPLSVGLAAGFGAFTAATAGGLAALQQRAGGWWAPMFAVGWLSLLAVTLGLSGSAKQAQLVGILAAMGGPLMMLAWAKPNAARVRMGWGWLVGVASLLGAGGVIYSNLNPIGALLLAAGALAPLATLVVPAGAGRAGRLAPAAIGLALALGAAISALALSPSLDI